MEAHTTVVGHEDLERVRPIESVAIKDHIEEARADDEPDHHAENDHHEVVDREIEPPTTLRAVHHDTRDESAQNIRDAVPIDRDRPNRKGHRVKALIEFCEHTFPAMLKRDRTNLLPA